jgi:hypothetical protein
VRHAYSDLTAQNVISRGSSRLLYVAGAAGEEDEDELQCGGASPRLEIPSTPFPDFIVTSSSSLIGDGGGRGGVVLLQPTKQSEATAARRLFDACFAAPAETAATDVEPLLFPAVTDVPVQPPASSDNKNESVQPSADRATSDLTGGQPAASTASIGQGAPEGEVVINNNNSSSNCGLIRQAMLRMLLQLFASSSVAGAGAAVAVRLVSHTDSETQFQILRSAGGGSGGGCLQRMSFALTDVPRAPAEDRGKGRKLCLRHTVGTFHASAVSKLLAEQSQAVIEKMMMTNNVAKVDENNKPNGRLLDWDCASLVSLCSHAMAVDALVGLMVSHLRRVRSAGITSEIVVERTRFEAETVIPCAAGRSSVMWRSVLCMALPPPSASPDTAGKTKVLRCLVSGASVGNVAWSFVVGSSALSIPFVEESESQGRWSTGATDRLLGELGSIA